MIKYSRSVNYYETDQMGIVHHSNYIRYFEEARLHWMDEIGLSYSGLEELGVIIPVTFVDCRYKNPVRFGDTISAYRSSMESRWNLPMRCAMKQPESCEAQAAVDIASWIRICVRCLSARAIRSCMRS